VVKGGAVGAGIVLIVLAGAGFLYPITDEGYSIPRLNDLCLSEIGQLGQLLGGSDTAETCYQIKLMTYGIYGLGLIALILIIVGAVVPGNPKNS